MLKKLYSSAGILTISLFLASCATAPIVQTDTTPLSEKYLRQAEQETGDARTQSQIQATQALLDEKQPARAAKLLAILKTNDTNMDDANTLALLNAQVLIETKQAPQAITQLNALSGQTLTPDEQNTRFTLWMQADAAQGQVLDLLNQSEQLFNQEAGDTNAQQATLQKTWELLNTFPLTMLQALQPQATTPYAQGWLALAIAAYPGAWADAKSPNLFQSLQNWQQQFPTHPAVSLISSVNSNALIMPSPPQHIALLLPLTGPYGASGNAIRNGFFAAYYANKSATGYAPNISVYDTNGQDITALYTKAVNEGADFVVGPLLKDDVAAIQSRGASVPTLALNLTPNQTSTNLYEFALSPLHEVDSVVARARLDGHQQAGLIITNDPMAQMLAAEFQKTWQQSGGIIANQMVVSDPANLAANVQTFFNLDQSNQRAALLDQALGEKTRNLPHRREDIDMLFLVASSSAGRQIMPFVNFYYANDLPVYSTTLVNDGLSSIRSHDLDRIEFPATPWMLDPKQTLPSALFSVRQQIQMLWPDDFAKQPKLYGFGVDAFDIVNSLNHLSLLPQFPVPGAMGKLSLQNNVVVPEFIWAQIRNGKPILVP